MNDYFNYFTEIEEHFQRRRGSILLLSTLDWALIETWKEAGIPLEAVLRGIDEAFDRYDARPVKTRKVNSLAELGQALDWAKTTDRTTVITIVSDAFTWTPGDALWDVGVPQVSARKAVNEAAQYQADVRKKQRVGV